VARSNALFGGRRAVLRALDGELPALGARGARSATLLDVGTGVGDIPAHARRLAARRGVELVTFGVELHPALAAASRAGVTHALCADAFQLPLADRAVDVVTCSQVLHHFEEADARRLLAELTRVARQCVIVGDLRRSWLAAGGFWLASWALGFHPVSRHDGVVSVLRGFTAAELRTLVRDAVGCEPAVVHRLGWRLAARWAPPPQPAMPSPPATRSTSRAAAPSSPSPRPSTSLPA
jgi:SAM-dependent methyltransferase